MAASKTDSDSKEKSEWVELAESLRDTYESIARGDVKASAAQVKALTDIFTRAYGKVTASAEDKTASAGLLILPTLGSGDSTQTCPICGHRLEQAANAA